MFRLDFQLCESKNFCSNYLTNFSINLDGIWYAVETCWADESHSHFILLDQYSRETSLLT